MIGYKDGSSIPLHLFSLDLIRPLTREFGRFFWISHPSGSNWWSSRVPPAHEEKILELTPPQPAAAAATIEVGPHDPRKTHEFRLVHLLVIKLLCQCNLSPMAWMLGIFYCKFRSYVNDYQRALSLTTLFADVCGLFQAWLGWNHQPDKHLESYWVSWNYIIVLYHANLWY